MPTAQGREKGQRCVQKPPPQANTMEAAQLGISSEQGPLCSRRQAGSLSSQAHLDAPALWAGCVLRGSRQAALPHPQVVWQCVRGQCDHETAAGPAAPVLLATQHQLQLQLPQLGGSLLGLQGRSRGSTLGRRGDSSP